MRLPSFLTRSQQTAQMDFQSQQDVGPDLEKQAAEEATSKQRNPDAAFPTSQTSYSHLSIHAAAHNSPPRALLDFQALTGIYSPTYFHGPMPAKGTRPMSKASYISTTASNIARPASNEGIYKRTVDEEKRVAFYHKISSWAVSTFYLFQIIVGAALTALGAASGPSAAVTILGALNTVIAGLLTYLKGQGLPARLESYLHQLRALREHIEERERRFLSDGGTTLSVDEEVHRIWEMYQEIRQTAQDNRPGNVLPPRGFITGLLKKPDIERKDVMAPVGDKSPADVLKHGIHDLQEYRHGMESKFHSGVGDTSTAINSMHHGAEDRISSVKDDVERLGGLMGRMMHHAEDSGKQGVGELDKGIDTLRNERDKRAEGAISQAESVADGFRDAMHRGIKSVDRKLDSRPTTQREDEG